ILMRHVPRLEGKLTQLLEATQTAFRGDIVREAVKAWDRMRDKADPMPMGFAGALKHWAQSRPTFRGGFVLLDEAPDSSVVVTRVVREQQLQKVIVGDAFQQLYDWRGAINAMAQIPTAHEAALTMSFRFGDKIAHYANEVLKLLGSKYLLRGNPEKQG